MITGMSRRPPNFNVSANPTTAQTLALLSEYTHVLDSLPLDLSRNFADLRELDAVLSSSMAALTYKIKQLTVMIEANSGSKEERLWLLIDIAEEAARLKLGGEDKIRVACHAADGLRGHRAYMKALLERAPDGEFEAVTGLLARKTVYPHVATRQYLPPGMVGEGGRRNRRGAYGSLLVHAAGEASPNKRKRAVVRDEDGEVLGKTPRKERAGDNLHAPRQRNGARSKKTTDRAASPTESLLSVASHLPQSRLQTQLPASNPRQNVSARAGSNASSKHRSRGNVDVAFLDSRKDIFNAPPPSSTHPSLPLPYMQNSVNGLHDVHNGRGVANGIPDWPHGQLEGPGMPVARHFAVPADPVDGVLSGAGEGDGEADDGKTYCFCNGVSYGAMIGCDDENCEREWFHLPCVGLATPPIGTWYCEACRARRSRRSSRGGKKRSGGARSGARNANA